MSEQGCFAGVVSGFGACLPIGIGIEIGCHLNCMDVCEASAVEICSGVKS